MSESEIITPDLTPNKAAKEISRREEIAQLREIKKNEEENNLTFQPKFSTKVSEENDSKSANRFDTLYQDAIKRKQSHSDPSPENSFSFSPKLSARVSSTKRDPSPMTVGERLYKLGTINKSNSIPSAPLDPEATFTPQISKRANSVDRNRSISTSDRLHLQSKEQQARLEKLRESMNAQMSKECSFTPRLSHSGSVSDNVSVGSARDVAQRLLSYEATRQLKIEQAKKQLEEQSAKDMTFRPHIPVSSRFATPTRQGQNIFEKLSKQTLQKDQNLAVSLNTMNHSFSSKSNRPPSERGSSDGKVFDRLAAAGPDKQKLHIELDKKRESLELSQCTFTPHIPQSEFIRPRSQSAKPIHIRLAEEAEKLKEEQKKRVEQQAKEDSKTNTFTPRIPHSEFIRPRSQSAKPIHIRLAEKAEKLKEEQKKRVEQQAKEELKSATFTPQLPRKSLTLGSNSAMNSTIFDRLTKEAEKQRDEYKRRDEVKRQDEMKDATFTPKIPLSAVKRPSIGATSNNNSIFDRLNAEAVKLKQQKQALQMQQSGFSFGSSAPSSARKVAPSVHNTTSNTATASTTSNSNVASTPRKVVNPAPAVKPVPSQDNSGWITKKPIQVPPVITTTDATTVQVENSVQILQPLSEQPEASTQATVTSSDAVESVEKDNTAAVVDVSSAIPTASTAVELPTQSESVSEEDGPVIELDIEQLKLDMEGNAVGELDVNEVETF